jgi:hypothetical protein
LTQTGTTITGTEDAPAEPAPPPGYTVTTTNSITGTISGSTVNLVETLTVVESGGGSTYTCRATITLTLQLTATNTLSGTFVESNLTCTPSLPLPDVSGSGSIVFTRQ